LKAHNSDKRLASSLIEQSWDYEKNLQEWHHNLVSNSMHPPYAEYTPLPGDSTVRPLCPTALSFFTFEVARMHLFYWSALLLIYDNIALLSLPPPSLTSAIAIKIAQSIPYLLSSTSHVLGPQNSFFPLRIAMRSFSQLGLTREEGWCQEVFEELDRRGFLFAKFCVEVEWSEIPTFLSETVVSSSKRNNNYLIELEQREEHA